LKPHGYTIAAASWPDDIDLARALLANYGDYLRHSPAAVCLEGYPAELQALPGKYAGSEADLLLTRVNGEGAGCAAITAKFLKDGTHAAEIKRLWVEPAFRGLGIGRGLVHHAVEWARTRGCAAVVLDTVYDAMPEAVALYRSMGFEETEGFNDNPLPGVRFYKLSLR
jgi:putative acetyltransferase